MIRAVMEDDRKIATWLNRAVSPTYHVGDDTTVVPT